MRRLLQLLVVLTTVLTAEMATAATPMPSPNWDGSLMCAVYPERCR